MKRILMATAIWLLVSTAEAATVDELIASLCGPDEYFDGKSEKCQSEWCYENATEDQLYELFLPHDPRTPTKVGPAGPKGTEDARRLDRDRDEALKEAGGRKKDARPAE